MLDTSSEIQRIDDIAGDFSAAPASEPPNATNNEAVQMVKPAEGTTSLGFVFKEGIMLASYASMSVGTSRIMEINPYMLSTMVGEPVDKLFWTQCQLYESQHRRGMPITLAAQLFEDMIDSHSRKESSVAALIAVWEGQSPLLYCVDNDDLGSATCFLCAVGSGSSEAYTALHQGYDDNMSTCEAASFARWAIHWAAFKHGSRNGVASVYYVGPNGWVKLFGDDVVKFPPFCYPVTMDEEATDEATSVGQWQRHLKWIERIGFAESDVFSRYGIHGTDLRPDTSTT